MSRRRYPPKVGVETKQRVAAALLGWLEEHRYPPSVREMKARVGGIDNRMLLATLAALREDGVLTWEQGKARTLRFVQEGSE